MSPRSPRRTEPRPAGRTSRLLLALAACVAFSGPGPVPAASSGGYSLPGQIPKAPAFATGFPVPFHRTTDPRPREGTVTAADLDGDGHPELIVTIPAGLVTVLRPDGTVLPGWPRQFDDLPQPAYPYGEPGIGDLDGDGIPDVVTCVVSGGYPPRSYLYAMHADGGDLAGWPVEVDVPGAGGVACSPAATLIADLDGDGMMEVARGMSLGVVVAYDGDGRPLPGWPVRLGPDATGHLRGINADLATGDLDGDGRMEVVFIESGLAPRMVAVSGTGHILHGFPRSIPEVVGRQAPVAGDLDGDGIPELVQATFPVSDQGVVPEPGVEPAAPASLHVLRADGTPLPGWPRTLDAGGPWGSLLLDVDGDGRTDILQQDGDRLDALDASGARLPGFPHVVHRDFLRAQTVEQSPWVISDLDGDGRPDFLQVRSDIYDGASYLRVFGLRNSGQTLKGFPFEVGGLLSASRPVLADLDGDGVDDLILLATEGTNGSWTLLAWDLGGLQRPRS
jgi:FG-GAP-like repeat